MARVTGRYEPSTAAGVRVDAYVPLALPPGDPPLAVEGALRTQLDRAEGAVQRLAWAASLHGESDGCGRSLRVKEAVVSVAMSGSTASILDLLTLEAERAGYPDSPREDHGAGAVQNYLDAVDFARDTRSGHPQPLNEAHRLLLRARRRTLRTELGRRRHGPSDVRSAAAQPASRRPGGVPTVPPDA